MAQQRDEIGRTGVYPPGVPAPDDAEVITPGEINEGRTGRGRSETGQADEKHVERLPRKGDELDDLGGKPTD